MLGGAVGQNQTHAHDMAPLAKVLALGSAKLAEEAFRAHGPGE